METTSGLPPLAELVAAVKAHGPAALDKYAPAIDELADMPAAAAFLGIQAKSITRARERTRGDGSPDFAPPDRWFSRSPTWRYRTLVLHRAAAPGRGGSGKWQKGQSGRTVRTPSASSTPSAPRPAASRKPAPSPACNWPAF